MHTIDTAAGQVIANDTQNSVEAADRAVTALASLCASIVEVSNASRLPVTTAQGALADAGDGLAKAIGLRDDLGRATRKLIKIQGASNLQATAFGCPPLKEPSASAQDLPAAQKVA